MAIFRVGLTGGIACGKSFIAQMFAAYGVPIIDSDLLAHEIVHPGSPALEEIVNAFGANMLLSDGSLNRRALRELVFGDNTKLATLNQITHPKIHQLTLDYLARLERQEALPQSYLSAQLLRRQAYIEQSLASCPTTERDLMREALTVPLVPSPLVTGYVILDIPLLFENHLEFMADRILVADASEYTQIARIMSRDHCDASSAKMIMQRQVDRTTRLHGAHDVIQTDALSMNQKRQHVLDLHTNYLALSGSH